MIFRLLGNVAHLELSDTDMYEDGILKFYGPKEFRKQVNLGNNFIKDIGLIGLNEMERAGVNFDIQCNDKQPSPNDADMELYHHLAVTFSKQIITTIVSFLWFIKDNSISPQNIYSLALSDVRAISGRRVFLDQNSNALGQVATTRFSTKEFDDARKISKKFSEITDIREKIVSIRSKKLKKKIYQTSEKAYSEQDKKIIAFVELIKSEWKWGEAPITIPYNSLLDFNKSNIIEKASSFVTSSRLLHYLPHKLSMLMSCFETLFSMDNQEINHKVAERVAFYIGETPQEQMEIYDDIRNAYNIRSRFMHGKTFDNKLLKDNFNVQELCIRIDEIARRVLSKVVLKDRLIFLQNDLEPFYRYLIYKVGDVPLEVTQKDIDDFSE